ncbi:MAG: hypothetical protein QXU54_03705 [Candidatus Micrarchaeia archaeon]
MEQQNQLEAKEYKCETTVAEESLLAGKDISNPAFLAQLLISIRDERERTNSMIATVIRKVEALEMKVEALEGELKRVRNKGNKSPVLGDIDSELLGFVRKMKRVTAEEVQKHFNYKGRNGASSRLHRLFTQGLLEKVQAGRKVLYLPK